MRFGTFYKIIFILTLMLTGLACDKQHAKKMEGVYSCHVEYHYWDMTPKNIDSTYFADLEVTRDGKNMIILGNRIHVDSLWKGKAYYLYSGGHNYLKVLMSEESIYVASSSGGLGGNATSIYTGFKKK